MGLVSTLATILVHLRWGSHGRLVKDPAFESAAMVYSSNAMKLLGWLPVAGLTLILVQPLFPQSVPSGTEDYSGMYSFVREGEFLQITIEDKGVVSGFISRFGDGESDKGAFLDQFFKTGKIEANKVSFSTESVHGVWYKFEGVFDRGPGKKPENEGYYVLRGILTRVSEDADHKTATQDRKVEFSSFPRDTTSP